KVEEVPEEFLADIVTNNNFVYVKLRQQYTYDNLANLLHLSYLLSDHQGFYSVLKLNPSCLSPGLKRPFCSLPHVFVS
ncbi:unnamed protein product, partial [Callosobruchus maculatus]